MSVLSEKCPHCGQGHVYEGNTKLFAMPVMNDRCAVCHYKFDREPGYFLGAMYISYAVSVLLALITFFLLRIFAPSLPTIFLPLVIILVILLAAKKNYKLSRVIYMHLFPW